MSLRPRLSPGLPNSPKAPGQEPDTPAAHYTERLDLGSEASRQAAAAHVHEYQAGSGGGFAAIKNRWAARLRRKGKFGESWSGR